MRSLVEEEEAALEQLMMQTGLQFTEARRSEAAAGLQRVQRRFDISDPEQFVHRMRSDRNVSEAVIDELTVGETYFFRDPAQFAAVREVVLPALLRRGGPERRLHIWSAGCSTGEEAYSLAILLEEEGLSQCASILGTDISTMALSRARRGEYGAWSMRGDPNGRLAPYFCRERTKFFIADRLRDRVTFEQFNLASDCGQPSVGKATQFDLVLCRNVLIYFSEQHVRSVAKRLYESLSEGGWLITGASDPPLWQHAPFTTVVLAGAVLYRRQAEAPCRGRNIFSGVRSSKAELDENLLEPASYVAPRRSQATEFAKAKVRPSAASDGRQTSGAADEEALIDRIRDLSRADMSQADVASADALSQYPLSIEIHYLRALLLVGLNRHDEAIAMLRRLLYLDRSLAVVHLTLGMLLERRGDSRIARRCYQSAFRLAAARPAEEEVTLSDGQSAALIATSAKARMAQLRADAQTRQR